MENNEDIAPEETFENFAKVMLAEFQTQLIKNFMICTLKEIS